MPLIIGTFGDDVVCLPKRVDNVDELQKTPLWIWSADDVLRKTRWVPWA